jgi:hypothetical protein
LPFAVCHRPSCRPRALSDRHRPHSTNGASPAATAIRRMTISVTAHYLRKISMTFRRTAKAPNFVGLGAGPSGIRADHGETNISALFDHVDALYPPPRSPCAKATGLLAPGRWSHRGDSEEKRATACRDRLSTESFAYTEHFFPRRWVRVSGAHRESSAPPRPGSHPPGVG